MGEDGRGEFARFYEQNRDICLRAVTARTGDRALAEDLVAESFARAWAAWPKVSRQPAPQAWVVRTALNAQVSWWRKHRREVPLADQDRPVAAAEVSLDPALVRAVSELPSRQREVFTLRILLDLDTETTARVLGIAPGTAMSHLSRAVASLRNTLRPSEGAPTRLENSHD
ncbi:MAG: sigma-70 family RNA polymerase sigma factor [Jatrophihabitantaceae bacterium]